MLSSPLNLSRQLVFPLHRDGVCKTFSVKSSARQVYLLIGGEDGNAKSFHLMEQATPGQWTLSICLKAGSHRYRYYADHGNVTTYLRPCERIQTLMEGLDALLLVRATKSTPRAKPATWGRFAAPSIGRFTACGTKPLLLMRGA